MRTQSGRNPLLERLKQVYWPIDGLFEEFSTSFPPLFLASLRVESERHKQETRRLRQAISARGGWGQNRPRATPRKNFCRILDLAFSRSGGWAPRSRAMRITRIIVSVIAALSIACGVCAQEALKGEVVKVDKASKRIRIKLSGTVGSSDATAPTPFKVQDARMFDAVKPGDKVSFTAEREDGVMTIKELTKE